jgi:hypothetical protein
MDITKVVAVAVDILAAVVVIQLLVVQEGLVMLHC